MQEIIKSKEYLYNRTPTKLNSDSKISLPPRHRKSDGTYSSTISPYLPKSEGKNMGDFWNEEIEKHRAYLLAQRNYRKWEHGKPSKKDRRDIDHFLEGW